MGELTYKPLATISSEQLMLLLNKQRIRSHLMPHSQFTVPGVEQWVAEKTSIDNLEGCLVRAVMYEGVLAGWCGVQPDVDEFEIAVVLDDQFWGAGLNVFKALMVWCKDIGHDLVKIHLLNTRKEYRFLKRMAVAVSVSHIAGHEFTTYTLNVQTFNVGIGQRTALRSLIL